MQDEKIEFETIAIIPYTKYENGIFEFELNYKLIPYFVKIMKFRMNLNSWFYQISYYQIYT